MAMMHPKTWRQDAEADAAKLSTELDFFSSVIDYGFALLARIIDAIQIGIPDASLIAVVHHAIAMLDAIEVLLRRGAGDAARVSVRSFFEAQLYAHWFLREANERRSRAYYVHAFRELRVDWAELDPTHDRSRRRKSLTSKHGWDLPVVDTTERAKFRTSRLDEIDKLLLRRGGATMFAPKMNRKGKMVEPTWTQVGGANNLSDIATQCGQEDEYREFYGLFCRDTHAAVLLKKIQKQSVEGIRTLHGFRMVTRFALSLTFDLYEALIAKYLPTDLATFQALRRGDWKQRYDKISDVNYADESTQP
jgi:hypothetical protein